MFLNNLSSGYITINEYGGEDSGDDIYIKILCFFQLVLNQYHLAWFAIIAN